MVAVEQRGHRRQGERDPLHAAARRPAQRAVSDYAALPRRAGPVGDGGQPRDPHAHAGRIPLAAAGSGPVGDRSRVREPGCTIPDGDLQEVGERARKSACADSVRGCEGGLAGYPVSAPHPREPKGGPSAPWASKFVTMPSTSVKLLITQVGWITRARNFMSSSISALVQYVILTSSA